MFTRSIIVMFFLAIAVTGCFHATIETGLKSSGEVITEPFAAAWIYGLVPPSTISAQLKCTHGVAKVETQISFVNGLIGAITLQIFTPMEIKVTCAASSTSMLDTAQPDLVLDESASNAEIRDALVSAADIAVRAGRPIYVKY